ncbi:MAG: HK97 family phage prohead protease [Vicinamibacterales bacterium]
MPDRATPYRDDLCRSAMFELVRADDARNGDGLTIDGYGAVFNAPTRINSWEGEFDEVIAPGAFKKSLRERTPIMQFDHGHHPLMGSLPLGRWDSVQEDDRGLHVVGRLSDNWLVQPFRDAIADGGVTGMSFRFSVVRDEWTDAAGKKIRDDELGDLLWYGADDRGPILRTLREVKVSEVGPVTWPAYDSTSVGVRSTDTVIDLGRIDLKSAGARDQLARAAALVDHLVAREQRATPAPGADPATGPVPDTRTTDEPRTTDAADEHAATAPPDTAPAGAHSSAIRSRTERAAVLARVRGAINTMTT